LFTSSTFAGAASKDYFSSAGDFLTSVSSDLGGFLIAPASCFTSVTSFLTTATSIFATGS